MSGEHHGLASAARRRRAEQTLEATVVAGVEVTTTPFQRSQRAVQAGRAILFAAGFALAFVAGLGWVVLSVGAVVHYLVYRTRQALVTTGAELALLTSGVLSTTVVERWAGSSEAELRLRPGHPEVEVRIAEWHGTVSGVDLEALESVIRRAGGEPLRVVDRS